MMACDNVHHQLLWTAAATNDWNVGLKQAIMTIIMISNMMVNVSVVFNVSVIGVISGMIISALFSVIGVISVSVSRDEGALCTAVMSEHAHITGGRRSIFRPRQPWQGVRRSLQQSGT